MKRVSLFASLLFIIISCSFSICINSNDLWAQSHIMYNNVSYVATDRQLSQVSEIYGFRVPDPRGIKYELGDYHTKTPLPDPSLEGIDYFDGTSMVDCFKGHRVLDMASGEGALVQQLRLKGVDAYGIDLREPKAENQCFAAKSLLEIDKKLVGGKLVPAVAYALMQGSITSMPYSAGSFDRIISTWGPFSYLDGKTKPDIKEMQFDLYRQAIGEMDRVLKDKGMVLLGPISQLYFGEKFPLNVFDFLQEELKDKPHLRFYRGLGRSSGSCSFCHYIIITKGDVAVSKICRK